MTVEPRSLTQDQPRWDELPCPPHTARRALACRIEGRCARRYALTRGGAEGEGRGESVHGSRRQIKRLRSLLRLLRSQMGEEAFAAANGALRESADALAGQRRAEALVAAAERMGGGRAARATGSISLWKTARHMSRSSRKGGLEMAQQALAQAAKVLAGTRIAPGPAQMSALPFSRPIARRGES